MHDPHCIHDTSIRRLTNKGVHMRSTSTATCLTGTIILASAFAFAACEKKAPTTPQPTQTTKPVDDHGHSHDDGHDHGHDHGGTPIALGEQTVGLFTIKATRDSGEIVAGKDSPIDATVTPTGTAKVAAVRFWIGTQDAKGSVKAKAEIEDPKNPNGWHTHAEIPSPLPEGSKIWVEVEDDAGAKHVAGFAFGS
jgi:hypothetical protein